MRKVGELISVLILKKEGFYKSFVVLILKCRKI